MKRAHKPNPNPNPYRCRYQCRYRYLVAVVVSLAFLLGKRTEAKRPPTSLFPVPAHEAGLLFDPTEGEKKNNGRSTNLIDLCKEFYYDSDVDHFSWSLKSRTYKQRVFVCDKYWQDRSVDADGKEKKVRGPIFFYTGNEADVTLYLNATGFMWEYAPEVGALLVFAEHRYYGKSSPFGSDDRENLQYLTSEQALADYANLIEYIKEDWGAIDSPVICFGGSYGGMLSSWFRMKYPHVVDGAFAASAPIWSFLGELPPYDAGSFAKVVTYDATREAGASEYCAQNIRSSWVAAQNMSWTSQGRDHIRQAFQLCDDVPLESSYNLTSLLYWAQTSFDYMAMGNYPYPSSYMTNGKGDLPAYPMRVACEAFQSQRMSDAELVSALAQASKVWYNYTNSMECLDYRKGVNPETQSVGEMWDYQFCTEMFMPSSRDGIHDMFFPQPFDYGYQIENCQKVWGVTPRPYWVTVNFGGKDINAFSNIIFSNGEYDPWRGGGVLYNVTESIHAIFIDGGAHHLDFMWSTKYDPPSVLQARAQERDIIHEWIEDAYKRKVSGRTYSF
ncbi:serine carboxypeptidase [Chloropicon primus]|uniref:Serine carboxypeptidase n=1 Tax=Chloropicon primus TaxID=1764295 RepID=A0A5B8MMI9_9CHLO|nr:serine carboxypeptidase [Chloropicon primus]UPR00468.1 serine carboxypeptidase [Chloropicon primus]|eukprot:QDZ21254.1 serine carboxypeptidase [Chloropicon primus]